MSDPRNYGRTVNVTFPPLLVRRLDHWIIERDKWRTRSSVVSEAVAFFLDHHQNVGGGGHNGSEFGDAEA